MFLVFDVDVVLMRDELGMAKMGTVSFAVMRRLANQFW
jgi:hypothetical protein